MKKLVLKLSVQRMVLIKYSFCTVQQNQATKLIKSDFT